MALILEDCAAYDYNIPFFIRYLKFPILNHLIYFFTTPKYRARFVLKRVLKTENINERILSRYVDSFSGKDKEYSFIKSAKQLKPKNYGALIEKYKTIETQSLILWGEFDKILSLSQGYSLTAQLINAQLSLIENCGHIPHEENPNKTFNFVDNFLLNLKI